MKTEYPRLLARLASVFSPLAKIFWLIVFRVDEEKFRAVEAANK